jgi:transcriptional regulator
MYRPKLFDVAEIETQHAMIRDIGFAALISHDAEGLEATHIPFVLEPERGTLGTLIGHVARANPHWRRVNPDTECLVVFQGPHGYVSPSWYPSRHPGNRVVPTWNYAAVHAYGHATTFDGPARLRAAVASLTDENERRFETPWSIDEAPADFIDGMLRGIIGIEVAITRLEGKRKLSQNRPDADRDGVIAALSETESPGDEALRREMGRRPRASFHTDTDHCHDARSWLTQYGHPRRLRVQSDGPRLRRAGRDRALFAPARGSAPDPVSRSSG